MKLLTKYFGEIDYEADDLLSFPRGLFGFEEERQFLLLPFADSDDSLLCLQSTQTPALAFVMMNPFTLNASYAPKLQENELREMGVANDHELCFYTLCVVKNPVSNSTVNFKCPVVIQPDSRKGIQVILESDAYGMRHLLSEFGQKEA